MSFAICLVVPSAAYPQGAKADFNIGVYYYPGWRDHQLGSPYPRPWEKIKPYPERKPLLGWYREGDIGVMSRQLKWMEKYGIDFVVFDWYWGPDGHTYLDHALNAYLAGPTRHEVEFAIMWANHTEVVFTLQQMQKMFDYWLEHYLRKPDYLKMDEKPVVFIFSAATLNRNANAIGMTSAELLNHAEQYVIREAGLPGLSFIGGSFGRYEDGIDYSTTSGYRGFSAYNYAGTVPEPRSGKRRPAQNYAELDSSYREQWRWMIERTESHFIVPMTSGWDRRPWGGSQGQRRDYSMGTPEEFELHLRAARQVMLNAPKKSRHTGVICCWNEYGEGSFIEPTEKDRFAYLEKVKEVFGDEDK